MNRILTVTRKELVSYFSSPVAYIFLGTFLFVSLFVFFWVEAFFARNILDVRPLFEWMPILMIFLVAALTMRGWSEEKKMGTIEFLMTMPISTTALVLGKFLACTILVLVALLLTLGIPFTVSVFGPLDWGPVIGAYVAALLLATAYVSIGLFVSALTDSQIVSLMGTIIIGGFLYLLGSDTLTGLAGIETAELLSLIGTGSRFESITRGVLDVRDLYYYLSICGIFLALNVLIIERQKWAQGVSTTRHRFWTAITALLVVNLLVGNITLQPVRGVRADLTAGDRYTISEATETILGSLQEPLLIRGYFSNQTHPLLAPLVPQIRDILAEYEVVGGGRVRTEFLDPRNDPDLETEANQKYGIRPMPFQVSEKYRESLVNSYFNILILYGDKFEVLDFRDLIEIKAGGIQEIDVVLRNIEYDITRSIKKVLHGFQTTDNLFATIDGGVQFTGYISPDESLPEGLVKLKTELVKILEDIQKSSNGVFKFDFVDPVQGNVAEEIATEFGFRPMSTSLFDSNVFYFYMVLNHGEENVQVPLPAELEPEGLRRSIDAALKRFSPGFLKTVGLVAAAASPQMPGQAAGRQFRFVEEALSQQMSVKTISLSEGIIPEDIDVLLLLAPERLSEREVFAVDQFLMKGGTIILATSPINVTRTGSSMTGNPHTSGLEEWLSHNGFTLTNKLVMDPQNEPYPVPVKRNLGGFTVEEIQLVPYPPFPDVRGEEGVNDDAGLMAGINQLTMNWAVPLSVKTGESNRTFTWLMRSSEDSWAGDPKQIEPDFRSHPRLGFPVENHKGPFVLGGILEGEFESYFKGKTSPLLEQSEKENQQEEEKLQENELMVSGIIERSPATSRIIIFSSNDFVADNVLQISAATGTNRYMNSLQVLQNSLDWALEDGALLSIRGRSHFARTLPALSENQKFFWEAINYILVLLGLLLIYALYRVRWRLVEARYQEFVNV